MLDIEPLADVVNILLAIWSLKTRNATFELLLMACNRTFNTLNILLTIL